MEELFKNEKEYVEALKTLKEVRCLAVSCMVYTNIKYNDKTHYNDYSDGMSLSSSSV